MDANRRAEIVRHGTALTHALMVEAAVQLEKIETEREERLAKSKLRRLRKSVGRRAQFLWWDLTRNQ